MKSQNNIQGKKTSNRPTMTVWWVILFAIGFCFFNIIPDLYQDIRHLNYQDIVCTVIDKKAYQASGDKHKYLPYVQVSYLANNQNMTQWVSVFSKPRGETQVQFYLANVTVGTSIPCWLDKYSPQVVINRGYHIKEWLIAISLLIYLAITYSYRKLISVNPSEGFLIKTEMRDLFRINYYKWVKEYLYLSDKPLTIETLPPELKTKSEIKNATILLNFNSFGRYVVISPSLRKFIYFLYLVIFILLLSALFIPAN
jgi:hypothetical protein